VIAYVPLGVEDLAGRRPWGTIGLVAAMFLLHATLPPDAARALIQHNDRFRPWTWLTGALLHADWAHLLGNMIFLVTIGMVVEGIVGTGRFLALFAGLAVTAGLVEQLMLWGDPYSSLGASGVIYGLMAVGVLWAPRSRIRIGYWVWYRVGMESIDLFWVALWWIGWDLFVAVMTGFVMSTPLLHTLGAASGVAAGLLALDRGWVDTNGQDWFSIRARERDDAPDKLKHVLVKHPTPFALTQSLIDHALATFAGVLTGIGFLLLLSWAWTDSSHVVGRMLLAVALIAAGGALFGKWLRR
jgi:membrane associated rhomboid family serine protease